MPSPLGCDFILSADIRPKSRIRGRRLGYDMIFALKRSMLPGHEG
jgi:hypothetical protein